MTLDDDDGQQHASAFQVPPAKNNNNNAREPVGTLWVNLKGFPSGKRVYTGVGKNIPFSF